MSIQLRTTPFHRFASLYHTTWLIVNTLSVISPLFVGLHFSPPAHCAQTLSAILHVAARYLQAAPPSVNVPLKPPMSGLSAILGPQAGARVCTAFSALASGS